jgi:hypothetical protein
MSQPACCFAIQCVAHAVDAGNGMVLNRRAARLLGSRAIAVGLLLIFPQVIS